MSLRWPANAVRRVPPDRRLIEKVEQWLAQSSEFVPLLTAFCDELPTGSLQRALRSLLKQVQRGATAEELCDSRAHLSTLLPLLACVTQHRSAVQQLNRVLSESLLEDRRRWRRRRVMAYPLVLIGLMLLVLGFLSVAVTPVFDSIFRDFALSLPPLTRAVLAYSYLRINHPLLLAGSIAGTLALVYAVWWWLMERGPLFLGKLVAAFASGNSRSIAQMSAFARRLGEAQAAELPLPVALRVAGHTCPSPFLRRIASQLADEREATSPIDDLQVETPFAALKSSTWFPATMVHLLDDKDADHQAMSNRLYAFAELLAERVESRFASSTGIAAQVSVALVGGLVATVLIALLLPLVSLVSALS